MLQKRTEFELIFQNLNYALYIISINQWKNPGMSNIKFTFYILVFGLLTMFVYSFIAGEPILMLQTPKQWLCAAQLALFTPPYLV